MPAANWLPGNRRKPDHGTSTACLVIVFVERNHNGPYQIRSSLADKVEFLLGCHGPVMEYTAFLTVSKDRSSTTDTGGPKDWNVA
jgi:hypothetical protein